MAASELAVMREYSERLVHKLEEKNSTLEATRNRLVATNHELMASTEELERARDELATSNDDLELRVRQRTTDLEAANSDLEAFSYSVSHDLRAPLRAIGAFSGLLETDFAEDLRPEARSLLDRIAANVTKMEDLISGLLHLASLGRQPLQSRPVKVSKVTEEVVAELRKEAGGRSVDVTVGDLPDCVGDS